MCMSDKELGNQNMDHVIVRNFVVGNKSALSATELI